MIKTIGGVRVVTESKNPDADFGPAIAFADAPTLFTAISEVARRLGGEAPRSNSVGILALLRRGGLETDAHVDDRLAVASCAQSRRIAGGIGTRDGAFAHGDATRVAAFGAVRPFARSGDRHANGRARRPALGVGEVLSPARRDLVGPGRARSGSATIVWRRRSPAATRRRRRWSRLHWFSPCFAKCWNITIRPIPTCPISTPFFEAFGAVCPSLCKPTCGCVWSPACKAIPIPHPPCPIAWRSFNRIRIVPAATRRFNATRSATWNRWNRCSITVFSAPSQDWNRRSFIARGLERRRSRDIKIDAG